MYVTKLHSLSALEVRNLLQQADASGLGRSVRQKILWFLFALEHDCNISLTCRHFAITRSTFMRWLERFDVTNVRSLEESARRPHSVRKPQTRPEVVALIRTYREKFPTMGKEGIRTLLREEHNMHVSASSIGRVIQRHKFFFADTRAHNAKNQQLLFLDREPEETLAEKIVDYVTPLLHVPEQLLLPEVEAIEVEDSDETDFGSSAIKGGIATVLLFFVWMSGATGVEKAHAAESSSFVLTSDTPNMGEANVGTSNGYAMNGGITWYQSGLQGTNYQIVRDPGTQVASSQSSQSLSSTASSAHSEPTGGGGHHSASSVSHVSSAASSVASHSSTSSHSSNSSFASSASSDSSSSESSESATSSEASSKSETFHSAAASSVSTSQPPTHDGMTTDGQSSVSCVTSACSHWIVQQQDRMSAWYGYAKKTTVCDSDGLCDTVLHPAATSSVIQNILLRIVVIAGVWAIPTLSAVFGWFLWTSSERAMLFPLFFSLPTKEDKKKRKKKRTTKKTGKKSKAQKKRKMLRRVAKMLCICLLAAHMAFGTVEKAVAAGGPSSYVYNGHLLTSGGAAVTTAHDIRFSFWRSADFIAGDTTGAGAVNTGAANYVNWQEVHTVTPDARGYFAVSLGSTTALPDLSAMSPSDVLALHLQVEVKVSGAADTAYELLDVNSADAAIDRSPILSVPFAQNAGLLDQHAVGTSAGNIPYLQSSGKLPSSTIPGATNDDFFEIDTNSTATGSIALRFGATLGKTLTYDIVNQRFEFNDDVKIQGDLTVTGLINGVDINALTEATGQHLKVSSGAGLNVNIAGGNYRVDGNVTNYAGASNIALQNNADNYLFFTSTGLTVNTIGFPNDKSYIPVAKVNTAGGSVSTITDNRVLQADDRQDTVHKVLHPGFEGAAYQGDGADNVGQMVQTTDQINMQNYYMWTSSRSTLNDYDILVYVTLPLDFQRWTNALNFTYRSTSANAADNKLDIQVYDTNGAPVSLSGSAVNLVSTSWATTHVAFTGAPTWTAGQKFLIRMKMSAKNNFQMHMGDLTLDYVELKKE